MHKRTFTYTHTRAHMHAHADVQARTRTHLYTQAHVHAHTRTLWWFWSCFIFTQMVYFSVPFCFLFLTRRLQNHSKLTERLSVDWSTMACLTSPSWWVFSYLPSFVTERSPATSILVHFLYAQISINTNDKFQKGKSLCQQDDAFAIWMDNAKLPSIDTALIHITTFKTQLQYQLLLVRNL